MKVFVYYLNFYVYFYIPLLILKLTQKIILKSEVVFKDDALGY